MTLHKIGSENMLNIIEIENASKSQEAFEKAHINNTLYWAYMHSKEKGYDLIDLCDVIWEYDVEDIVNQLRAFGVNEFTISSSYSSLLNVVKKFIDLGCTLKGMTMLEENKPALLFEL
jgi:hypothetical protein